MLVFRFLQSVGGEVQPPKTKKCVSGCGGGGVFFFLNKKKTKLIYLYTSVVGKERTDLSFAVRKNLEWKVYGTVEGEGIYPSIPFPWRYLYYTFAYGVLHQPQA